MAVVSVKQVQDIVKSGGEYPKLNWLNCLKTTGDTVRVRVLLRNIDDLRCETVHSLPTIVNGQSKTYKYECLNTGNIDDCPLCVAGVKREGFVLVPLLIDNQIVFWSRGVTFIEQLKTIMQSYDGDLCNYEFNLTRTGLPKSPDTTYQLLYAVDTKPALWDLLPKADVFYEYALNRKTAEELNYYIETGEFPQSEAKQKAEPTTGFKKPVAQPIGTPAAKNPFTFPKRQEVAD